MAYIQKRNGSWRASVVRKKIRKTATFDTRREAELWALALENEILDSRFDPNILEAISPSILSMIDIFERYAKEVSIKKRGYRIEIYRLKALIKNPFFDIPINDLTTKKMVEWRSIRLAEVSPSTLNRELNLISSVINYAIKEWNIDIGGNPLQFINRPKSPKPRQRRVSLEEQEKIGQYLGWDKVSSPKTTKHWVAFSFFLALETAMRKGEILSMHWKDLYLDQSFIHLEITKNGDSRDVPLSSEAKRLLKLLTPHRKDDKIIPITSDRLTKVFIEACKKCSLKDLHFHDTRREATTNLAKKLNNVLELSAVTGHKTLDMLKVYYNPKASELAKRLD